MTGGADGIRGYGGHPLLAAQDAQVHLLELSRGVDAEPTGQHAGVQFGQLSGGRVGEVVLGRVG